MLGADEVAGGLSSGLTSRPSLSGCPIDENGNRALLSSGLTSRPSLSVAQLLDAQPLVDDLSSGLTSRPSLSDVVVRAGRVGVAAVVGVNLPTFVERLDFGRIADGGAAVVGVNLPTFVERSQPAPPQ